MLDRQLQRLVSLDVSEVAVSPDLSRLAFIREEEDPQQAGLWVTSEEKPEPRQLVASQDVLHSAGRDAPILLTRPRWSADRQQLAFASYQGLPPGEGHRLWVVSIIPGSAPTLLYGSDHVISAHRWSPDGSCLAVANSGAGLILTQLDKTSEVVDGTAMRYPLGENAMTWLDGGQRLLYVNTAAGEPGLWSLNRASGRKRQLVALSEDEILIPAGVSESNEMAWGALRGRMGAPEDGLELSFWSPRGEALGTIALPSLVFDPASGLLPTRDGSLWAFTGWREGQRVPLVVDRRAEEVHAMDVGGTTDQLIGWSEAPPSLWVLLHPPHLVGLDPHGATNAPLLDPVQTNAPFSVELGSAELIYLLETLDASSMMGLINPFAELEEAKVEKAREDAEASLVAEGWVDASSSDRLEIDLVLAALVRCCASPQQTWTTTSEKRGGERDVRHIHRAEDLIVEDTVLDSGRHRLTPLRGHSMVLQRIKRQTQLEGQPAASGQPFTLEEEALLCVRNIAEAQGEEAASRRLISAGVPKASAAQFARALARPLSNSSVSSWAAQQQAGSELGEEGIGILEGPSGLWLLQPVPVGESVRVTVSPANAQEALEQIAHLLKGSDIRLPG